MFWPQRFTKFVCLHINGIMHGTVLYADEYTYVLYRWIMDGLWIIKVLNNAKELLHFFVPSWKVISLDEQTYMWALQQTNWTEQRERKNSVSCYPPSRKDLGAFSCSDSSVDSYLFFCYILWLDFTKSEVHGREHEQKKCDG